MKQTNNNIMIINGRVKYFLLLISITLFYSACYTPKKVKYLQDNVAETKNKYNQQEVEYRLQIGDNLYILLSSTDAATNEALNQNSLTTTSQGVGQKYKDVFQIDQQGCIKHTQLNKIAVAGLTLEQARDSIEAKIGVFYKQVTANIRIADNYITILGEIASPGRYLIDYNNKISIFSLIAMAGDLNIEANRKNIQIIRKNGAETEIVNIDITKKDIVENKYYYLMPNDIIYVEPMRLTFWGPRNFPFITTASLILSTATSIFVFYNYFK